MFDAANGGAILWQHLFWFFGHPEVYIIALPFFGIITEILPVFSRKPIFGYMGLVAATLSIAALSVAVWAHHMFTTGAVDRPFFSFMTFLIAIPTGVKFFNWIGTMWGGSLTFETPMLWSLGFLTTFLFGGLTGVILASPPLDFAVSDSYFVVAHFHYVVFGTVVFAMFGGFYFWWPKLTGRMLDERLGKIHFWLLFVGFHLTFLVQHWLGVEGFPRRYADYQASDGFTTLNEISSIGAFLLGASMIPFALNVWKTRHAPMVETDDPWGWGRSLEWATSSPPPRHNFHRLPRIRSEAPAFDLHHPEVAALEFYDTEGLASADTATDTPDTKGRAGHLSEQLGGELPPDRERGERPMRIEAWTMGVCGVFFGLVTPIYWFLSEDPTGTSALVMTTLLAGLVAFYLGVVARQIDPRPEDHKEAEVADGAGELGFFPPYSWWPLYTAAAVALVVLGVVIGWWLVIIGVGLVGFMLIGFVFEYYRGYHAH